jgi:hypothetical protein
LTEIASTAAAEWILLRNYQISLTVDLWFIKGRSPEAGINGPVEQ